jgi:hypothetical protein
MPSACSLKTRPGVCRGWSVLQQLLEIGQHHAERTVFARFVPPVQAEDAFGSWKDNYRKWWMMTGEHLPEELIGLAPSLQKLVPPARVYDKTTYSPWIDGRLFSHLHQEGRLRSL